MEFPFFPPPSCQFYPRDVKFVSLFPNEPLTNEKMVEKKDFIRSKIAEMRGAGLLADSKKLLRWRDLSTSPVEEEDDDDEDEDEKEGGDDSEKEEEETKDKEDQEGEDEFFAAANSNVGDISKREQYVVEDHLFANKVAEVFNPFLTLIDFLRLNSFL